MPCLVALFALISPRLAIFLLWLFTDRMTLAFTSGMAGILRLPVPAVDDPCLDDLLRPTVRRFRFRLLRGSLRIRARHLVVREQQEPQPQLVHAGSSHP